MTPNPTYYPGDLARDLLDAAIGAIASDAPAAISLRSLARSVGVSHAAPTNHFGDKAGLFAAIAVEGFDSLIDAIEAVDDADPLRGLGVAYILHAVSNPAHFAVMWDPSLHRDAPTVVASRDRAFHILVAAAATTNTSATPSPEVVERATRAWIVAHGWATLLLSGSLTVPDDVDAETYLRRELHHISVD